MSAGNFTESKSQAQQDLFVLAVTGKRNGFFLEIGGFHSEKLSNTYLLEKGFGWRGVTVEFVPENAAEIASNRAAAVICQDATTIRWADKRLELNVPKGPDYLQVDCEPALSSLLALWRVVVSGIRPKVITFEHDAYAKATLLGVIPQGRAVRSWSRLLLRVLGYTLVAANIATQSGKPFEDWWVRNPGKTFTRLMGTSPITPVQDFMLANGLYAEYERVASAG